MQILSASLKEPLFKTIECSQLDCGYSSKGFDPNLITIEKYQKGMVNRPSTEEYQGHLSIPQSAIQLIVWMHLRSKRQTSIFQFWEH